MSLKILWWGSAQFQRVLQRVRVAPDSPRILACPEWLPGPAQETRPNPRRATGSLPGPGTPFVGGVDRLEEEEEEDREAEVGITSATLKAFGLDPSPVNS